jgi:hypothetical protein
MTDRCSCGFPRPPEGFINPIGVAYEDAPKYKCVMFNCTRCGSTLTIPWSAAGVDLRARAALVRIEPLDERARKAGI